METKRPDDGIVKDVFETNLWKHYVPSGCALNELKRTNRDIRIVLTVRDLVDWLTSMLTNSYSVKPQKDGKRKKGWLFEPITIVDNVSQRETHFESAVDLWFCYNHC